MLINQMCKFCEQFLVFYNHMNRIEIKDLLGQGSGMQSLVSLLSDTHENFFFFGCRQSLFLCWNPPPHVAVQPDHSAQGPHLQVARLWNKSVIMSCIYNKVAYGL